MRRLGRGRVLAFMSDPAPHWGLNFVQWDGYADFWLRCVDAVVPRPGRGAVRAGGRRR